MGRSYYVDPLGRVVRETQGTGSDVVIGKLDEIAKRWEDKVIHGDEPFPSRSDSNKDLFSNRAGQEVARRRAEHEARDGSHDKRPREQEITLKGVWQPFHDEQTVQIFFRNGHSVIMWMIDGWLIVEGDSTLTVRPVNEKTVYVRPVGYKGAWIPEFAPKPLGEIRRQGIEANRSRRKR